jgi:hypothetical protein
MGVPGGFRRTIVLAGFVAGQIVLAPGTAAAQALVLGAPGVAFVALAGGPNPAPRTVAVSRPGAPLTWQVVSTMPGWLKVTPLNGTTPAVLTFEAHVAGLPAGIYRATVALASNEVPPQTRNIPVMLTVVAPAPGDSVYAVELNFTGYTGLVEGYPYCAVNPRGTDTLEGLVSGREAGGDKNAVYTGTMVRLTSVDICETRGKRGPDDDERVWCAATLTGTSVMKAEITVYGESGRGAWIKARHDGGPSTSSVTGACHGPDQLEWERAYPGADDGGGAGPTGQPVDDPQSRLFGAGGARLVVGRFPPERPQKSGDWVLNVVNKIR